MFIYSYRRFVKEAFNINKIFNIFFIIVLVLTIFICVFFIPTYSSTNNIRIVDFIDNGELLWPAPGITRINSYFGKRTKPTSRCFNLS